MEEDVELHERVKAVEVGLEVIRTNHLPHLQAKLDKVDDRLWWLLGVVILGIVITIASNIIFK